MGTACEKIPELGHSHEWYQRKSFFQSTYPDRYAVRITGPHVTRYGYCLQKDSHTVTWFKTFPKNSLDNRNTFASTETALKLTSKACR